ncbi:MAG: excinuclease ABC subunit UvrC [Dehalococcoidia bacterium]|nr:excinuclease ABC subunit UvrC [Dehalococcoidia bacterium]
MKNQSPNIAEQLTKTPVNPGVYLMQDSNNQVLYVGKAKHLKNRIRSYFNSSSNLSPKIQQLVHKIERFEFIVTETETEALILENNLIKQLKPYYNDRLKDDKTYPFIKVTLQEKFPKVLFTRNIKNDGSKYFGPFTSARSVRTTMNLLKKLFPYRSCTKTITGKDERPCLDFHINRCVGPCIGASKRQDYNEIINQVILFLEGDKKEVIRQLKTAMEKSSVNLEYEKAANYRDQIHSIEQINEKQRIFNADKSNQDIIGIHLASNEAAIQILHIRNGNMIGRNHFIMESIMDNKENIIAREFIEQYYNFYHEIPSEIIVQTELDTDKEITKEWLKTKKNKPVKITVPYRGDKKKLLNLAIQNAKEQYNSKFIGEKIQLEQAKDSLIEIEESLGLNKIPTRIECYDISNIQGTNPVGSMTVFIDGKPSKSHYRKFKIANVKGINDYEMMKEVLSRRLRNLKDTTKTEWNDKPDLIIIDGGKGHLNASLQTLLELGQYPDISICSLAKKKEEIFIPEQSESIILSRNSKALHLFQFIRDEAHRFAITFHRSLRSKKSNLSILDSIPGIGPKKKYSLLEKYQTIKQIENASIANISKLYGFNNDLAQKVKNTINEWRKSQQEISRKLIQK